VLPDGIFYTKNPNLGIFWSALELKMLVYFMVIWKLLRPFWYIYGHFVLLWSFGLIFPRFGVLCQEKSGNPGGGGPKTVNCF
jgi:hypothetical protein